MSGACDTDDLRDRALLGFGFAPSTNIEEATCSIEVPPAMLRPSDRRRRNSLGPAVEFRAFVITSSSSLC